MASEINEISDVEELIRQTGMDTSDTGGKIVDYFKNKRAALQSRGRLYDGSDNPINFRLDNLKPVQLSQPTTTSQPTESSPVQSSNDTEEASIALVKPLSELSVVENRLSSFVSPGPVVAISPVQIPQKSHTNAISSPSGRSTVHKSPLVSNTNLLSGTTNLQKQLLLQQYQRKNQMKCETIRSASQLVSSTPILGREASNQRGDNLLDIRETISPIHEDQEHGTPQRVLRSPTAERQRIAPRPSTPSVRSINTPVPATQDVPDGMNHDYRENTPPRDENYITVPETPSPVRRSPRQPSTPLSGLSLQRRSHLHAPLLAKFVSGQGRPTESGIRSPSSTPSQRSILKNPERSSSAVRNRVSFSEKLFTVRSLTPVRQLDELEITSDESEDQEAEKDKSIRKKVSLSRMKQSNGISKLRASRSLCDMETDQITSNSPKSPEIAAKQVANNNALANSNETNVRNEERNVHRSRQLFGNRRSNAIERIEESLPASPDAIGRCDNRTNGNVINMILDDWNEETTKRMEVEASVENPVPQLANETVNKSVAITNIETPRTVMMDIFDPPSAFCDDSEQGDQNSSQNDHTAEHMSSEAPGLDRGTDSSRKRKQDSLSRRDSIHADVEPDVGLNPNAPVLPKRSVLPVERIVSVDSPNDRVPMDMIEVVDMIHSRANSEMMATDAENDRRTTLNIPQKRRCTKLKADVTTEMYMKSIQKPGLQDETKAKKSKNRRKLFVLEMMEGQDGNSDGDEPQPLPATQEVVAVPAQQEQDHGCVTKPLAILVQRLSANTLTMATKATPILRNAEITEINEQHHKPVESPIKEKQNEEQNEKEGRSKIAHGKTPAVDDSEHRVVEADKGAKQKTKQRVRKNKRKPQTNGMDKSNLMMDKFLKNVSNEIRHQIESENGPRRSHRNRRLAAEVLRNNPDISLHDAPKYVMPTIKDVLKYCQLTDVTGTRAKKKTTSSNAADKKKDVKSQKVVPVATSSGTSNELGTNIERGRGRGRPRKIKAQKEKFDSDGFRVPDVPPSDGMPKTSSTVACKPADHFTETICSSTSGLPQGESIDSGLSSAAMMSDDATPQPVQRPSSKTSSKPKKTPIEDAAPSGSSAASASNEILAEKRKTLDWMMMLMENRQNRPVALPTVEIQGFTHLSLEHLAFEERDGIEYSFYVYSNGDNFGFLRFPPKAEKKTTRTKRCSLKFLILSGSLKFIINENLVNGVGGDFLMIPSSSSYRIINGTETTLMFMIKTSVSNQTGRENGG
ncbi:uncharacterized protein LOC125764918 isoform X2 [Anopheles funestus]|uniref:uncharacterized protein LOC125764918 isoform X2 n=1 Tax=Anopheles funestus TaxID=62324 RepID=UPI0020C6CE7D|nr:uncharacterized protein LOC125764918 isoform X2 [Anopheles funestus]